MGDPELPVPRRGDVLFTGVRAAWHLDALLDYGQNNDYAYRQGYRRAGRILTEHAAREREVDLLVFPICHAYRHFTELALKRLIFAGCKVVGREMTKAEAKLQGEKHNLAALWAAFKVIEKEVSAQTGIDSPPPEQMDGIEAYIEQLHAVDEGSFSFRYALTKTGEVSLGELKRINLGNFSDLMERLCDYLDGFDMYYGELIQQAHDMYGEMNEHGEY